MTDPTAPSRSSVHSNSFHPAWHFLWVGILGLAVWTRWQTPWVLLVPASVSIYLGLKHRAPNPLLTYSSILLLLGAALGFVGQARIGGSDSGPQALWEKEAEEVSHRLSQRFEAILESGDAAVHEALQLMATAPLEQLQDRLSQVRQSHSITALAVYDSAGRPQAWVGVHRGRIPLAIRDAELRYAFGGGPLFRYLYFTARAPDGGGTAVAAVLLQANLPGGLEGGGFVSRFRRETGVPVQILPPARVTGPLIWDLGWEGQTLLSVSMQESTPQELWAPRVRYWVRLMAGLAILSWALLAMAARQLPRYRVGAQVTLVAMAFLFPAEDLWPSVHLTSPAQFLLPVVGSLGQVLGLLLALAVLCGLLTPRRPTWSRPLTGAVLVALTFPLLELLFRSGPSPALFSQGADGWLPYQGGLAILLTLVACLALESGSDPGPELDRRWALVGGVGLAAGLGFLGSHLAQLDGRFPTLWMVCWGPPAYFMARGLEGLGRSRRLLSWTMAAILGSTAALPAAWGTQIQARMTEAEAQLMNLGAEPDPYLEYRLLGLAQKADSLDRIISSPVEFLFEIWSETGRNGDPLPMWLTLWSPGNLPREQLALGLYGSRPLEADDFLDVVRETDRPLIRHRGLENARYLLTVPLSGDRVLTAVVPPQGSLALSSPLGPIFASFGRAGLTAPSIVPAPAGITEDPPDGVEWERRAGGWEGKRLLRFPEVWYTARLTVATPGTLHRLARGTLALLLDLVLLLGVWGLGRVVSREWTLEPRQALRVLGSFRGRVTLALFGFFLLSIAIFGTLAFRTLSGAAQRTASALAERIVEDGASGYSEAAGSMSLLAQRVRADLLEYRDGELIDGSDKELVDLGLYEGWIPQPLFRSLEDGTEVRGTMRSALGRWDYVMAYRRLQDGDVLGTPVSVEVGATALRRQEVADLLGFAIVLGAALSLALALLVGRTLTRPIETLQVASERVGSGNLKVRLPENRRDEFGAVFGAFNRMVLRIRRSRRALLRTTRRTQAIVEEAATGVVALDSAGRVTLVNPRAESLLRESIPIGRVLPSWEGDAGELARWLGLYFRDDIREANTEIQIGARRIRARVRRISEEGPLGGAVVSLEDVTDELRTERILAWGEMAQQVAHEVKNPLTPIKLSVQHLQRAWEDRRPDFGEILSRNVGVILREIEHLAAIARSFSRFGAPKAAGEIPLEPVNIGNVAEEVMNLYGGEKGALVFRLELTSGLPLVRSREAEMREVLINLLENSRAAIAEEGEVVIEASPVSGGVEMRVRDNGKGIPTELLPRIFEPHFSTRSTGTGLGLAIVRRLVESWGGSVSAESREGAGTVIRFMVPRWDLSEVHTG